MKRLMTAFALAAAAFAQTSGRVTGRISAQGGEPLRGEVAVVSAGGMVRMRSVPADDRGVFAADVPAGRALLVARADGYISEEREVTVAAGAAHAAIQFTLPPAGSVAGHVFDENGAPVPGARVWAGYPGQARAWRLAEEAGGEPTDESGAFRIPAVAQGRPFVLYAETDGRLPSPSGMLVLRGSEMAGVVLMLSRRGASVRGRVLDASGNPVAGATVRLRARPSAGEFTAEQRGSVAFARHTNRTTISAADGSYIFTGVPAGRVALTGEAGGKRGHGQGETASGAETAITVTVR